MRGNVLHQETQLFEGAWDQLRQLLPASWHLELDRTFPVTDYGFDATMTVTPPSGPPTRILVEAKLSTRGHMKAVIERLRYVARDDPALILTDFANPALRRGCREAGLGYLDLTGWAYLATDTGLLVSTQGALRSPAPSNERATTMSRLDGPGASAVIRELWDVPLPIGVRELASRVAVSPGTVAKVLPALVSYGAVERDERGVIVGLDRRLLIERWTEDYGIYTTNHEVHWLLDPRGIEHAFNVIEHVARSDRHRQEGIAITGELAALLAVPEPKDQFYPVIPPSLAVLYSGHPMALIKDLGFREASAGTANVAVVRPRDMNLLSSDLGAVPPAQALADLMTMGSRFPELAEQILEAAGTARSEF